MAASSKIKIGTQVPINSVVKSLEGSNHFQVIDDYTSYYDEGFYMFLHLMVNQVQIVDIDTMNRLANKMYKFSKYFHIFDN